MPRFKAEARKIGLSAIVARVVQAIISFFGDGDKVFRSIVDQLDRIQLILIDGFKGRDVAVEATDRNRIGQLEKQIADNLADIVRMQMSLELGMTPRGPILSLEIPRRKAEIAKARDQIEGVKAKIQARRDAEVAGNTGDDQSQSTSSAAPLSEALTVLQKKLEEELCPAIEGLTEKLNKVPTPDLMLGSLTAPAGSGRAAAAMGVPAIAGLPDSARMALDGLIES